MKGEKRYYLQTKREDHWQRKEGKGVLPRAVYCWRSFSCSSPFPKHFPYHLIFGSFLFKLLHFWGFSFYTLLWFQFWNSMQGSESPIIRLSGKATVHIYDKNITNKIHTKCHRCHISDPGGWLPPSNAKLKMKWATKRAWISRASL